MVRINYIEFEKAINELIDEDDDRYRQFFKKINKSYTEIDSQITDNTIPKEWFALVRAIRTLIAVIYFHEEIIILAMANQSKSKALEALPVPPKNMLSRIVNRARAPRYYMITTRSDPFGDNEYYIDDINKMSIAQYLMKSSKKRIRGSRI